ncbi:hypothetical protein D9M70_416840 [compost metagenome]
MGAHPLARQVGAGPLGLHVLLPDGRTGHGHRRAHLRRLGLIGLDFGLARLAPRFVLLGQALAVLAGHLGALGLPAVVLGQLDHRAQAHAALLEAAPHRLRVTQVVAGTGLAPGVPGIETVLAELGLHAHPHLPPGLPVGGRDIAQQQVKVGKLQGHAFIHGTPPAILGSHCR